MAPYQPNEEVNMNNYKSQGQTFEQARVNLESIKVVRKQRELGLEFDMADTKDTTNVGVVTTDMEGNITGVRVGSMFLDYSDIPDATLNRTLLVDIDQFLACRPDVQLAGEDPAFEKIYGEIRELVKQHDIEVITSPTGRHTPRVVMDWQTPGKMRTIDKAEITLQLDGDFTKLEEMCMQDVAQIKHPLIFKITDLIEDPDEFPRLRDRLEKSREMENRMGWTAPPIFIEALPDANVLARVASDVMESVMKLVREFQVDVYFGPKTALKTVMYSWMYGARGKDLDLSQIEQVTVEKAKEIVDKERKIAIVGGCSIGASLAAALSGFHKEQLSVIGHSSDMWNFNELAGIAKLDKPARDWEQGKLRRGKGHNKFKRKGKK